MSPDTPWTDFCAPDFPAPARAGGPLALVRLLAAWTLVTLACAYLGVLGADLFRPASLLSPVTTGRRASAVLSGQESAAPTVTSAAGAIQALGCDAGATAARCASTDAAR